MKKRGRVAPHLPGYRMPDAGYRILVAGCRILDSGYWLMVNRFRVFESEDNVVSFSIRNPQSLRGVGPYYPSGPEAEIRNRQCAIAPKLQSI